MVFRTGNNLLVEISKMLMSVFDVVLANLNGSDILKMNMAYQSIHPQLDQRLSSLKDSTLHVLSLRTALRVLPLTIDSQQRNPDARYVYSVDVGESEVIRSFRAAMISWAIFICRNFNDAGTDAINYAKATATVKAMNSDGDWNSNSQLGLSSLFFLANEEFIQSLRAALQIPEFSNKLIGEFEADCLYIEKNQPSLDCIQEIKLLAQPLWSDQNRTAQATYWSLQKSKMPFSNLAKLFEWYDYRLAGVATAFGLNNNLDRLFHSRLLHRSDEWWSSAESMREIATWNMELESLNSNGIPELLKLKTDELRINLSNYEKLSGVDTLSQNSVDAFRLGVGGNFPPEGMDDLPLNKSDLKTVNEQISKVSTAANNHLSEKASFSEAIAELQPRIDKSKVWIERRKMIFDEAAKSLGKTVGSSAGLALVGAVVAIVTNLEDILRLLNQILERLN